MRIARLLRDDSIVFYLNPTTMSQGHGQGFCHPPADDRLRRAACPSCVISGRWASSGSLEISIGPERSALRARRIRPTQHLCRSMGNCGDSTARSTWRRRTLELVRGMLAQLRSVGWKVGRLGFRASWSDGRCGEVYKLVQTYGQVDPRYPSLYCGMTWLHGRDRQVRGCYGSGMAMRMGNRASGTRHAGRTMKC